jgi:hypothetical protein
MLCGTEQEANNRQVLSDCEARCAKLRVLEPGANETFRERAPVMRTLFFLGGQGAIV